jgi:catechol-2,3-dioxygenase
MLENIDAMTAIAVKDLAVAREFYEGTLGLKVQEGTGPAVMLCTSGNTRIMVYQSQFAGTNQATAVVWSVGDRLEAIVSDLAARGVAFEHYDYPGAARQGDIHGSGSHRSAWLKDPDGNVLQLIAG